MVSVRPKLIPPLLRVRASSGDEPADVSLFKLAGGGAVCGGGGGGMGGGVNGGHGRRREI